MQESSIGDNQQANLDGLNLKDEQKILLYKRLSWLGGIIDGEGMIYLHRRNDKRGGVDPKITIVNTSPILIQECIAILRAIRVPFYVQTKKPANKTWKTKIEIIIAGLKRCEKAIPFLLPYLVDKQHKCEMLYEFIKSRRANSYKEYGEKELFVIEWFKKFKRQNSFRD
jgi:hypothetical protein